MNAVNYSDSTHMATDPASAERKTYVHDLVQEQASATPDATAVVCGNDRITYRELNSRANQLADHLRNLGVGPEVPVAICMGRSIELAVAALGILKAGGAYVPLDPTYPARRLSMLLEDSATLLVITQPGVASKLPAGNWRTIVLDKDKVNDTETFDVTPQSIRSSPRTAGLQNLAYIIFTSGSSGRPKGVKITHANLLNLVRWHLRAFNVTSSDRATLHASPGFDASVWEMWPYLVAGASLHVVDEAVRATPNALRDWLLRSGITISFLPTVLAESLIGLPWPQKSALRLLLTGADTLHRRPPRGLPFALVNNYGPTECTVVATSGTVLPQENADQRPDRKSADRPSIGRPIDNVTIYVVDEHLQPVPSGTAGELLIGGRGVGQGYLNSADKTAASFLPDSFSNEPGAHVYRTGDLVRLLPDGQLAYLGRIDDQIKVMGHRIEPNEIVAVLNSHRQIQASFVCTDSDSSHNQRLVAYVVPKADTLPNPGELRSFLSTHLPSHMVPSAFVRLAQLPLSAHGKLDREALPRPTAENMLRDDSSAESVSSMPASPIEEHLAAVLSGLLGVPRVGSEENFFTLGGHSLMAAQLIAKIRDSFGVELSLRRLFEEPTPRGMSLEIEKLIHARLAAMSEEEAQQLLASSEEGL